MTKQRIMLFAVLGFLVIGGLVFFFNSGNNDEDSTSGSEQTATREVELESGTVSVPEDVPDDALTGYTLITENEFFKIRLTPSASFVITLYAVINRPDQYEVYKEQLRDYKQKALDYLRNEGYDLEYLDIIYEPAEAKEL